MQSKRIVGPAEVRFWPKVDRDGPGGCWIWTAGFSDTGYGSFWDGSTSTRAHRWAYEHLVGPVPDGLQLDHLCRVRACVNPAHMEPVTSWENTRRGDNIAAARAAQTHCLRGHEFTPENTYVRREGWRNCKACKRLGAAS